jgi:hypothetical protein
MVFFWVGTFCTYLLALFSLPTLRDRLAPRLWRTFLTIALEYIALVFFADFIVFPIMDNGLSKYPLTYLPFALMVVSAVSVNYRLTFEIEGGDATNVDFEGYH